MKSVRAVRVVLVISLISLVCGLKPESSKTSSSSSSSSSHSHNHKHRPKRYEEDESTEQVYYVDQIASDSEISPWTSNRIIAKSTENGKQSQYIINVSPNDEVIIHDGATDRTSDQEPDQDQSPQDFVQQALRMREQYLKGSGAKVPTPLPASSFVEYTTIKYDHHGPSKSPPSAAPLHYSKPVPSKVPPAPPAAAHQTPPVNYRPKHIKPKPTKLPVNTVTPYSDIELPEAEATSPYRKEKPKDQPFSPKHTPIKQQDTQASSMYIQKVKPIEPVFTSYNTHHDTGSSFKEFQQLPITDSHGSGSILKVQKVKPPTDTFSKHKLNFYHEDSEDYHEKKPKKHHISSEEIRYKPKHIKSHDHHVRVEQTAEFYPEKIRHTVERQPIKHPKESSADPFSKYYQPYESVKSSVKHEPEPSVEPYRYQPPKSYPPEEAVKYKFPKEVSTTPEPYKPYKSYSYAEEKHKKEPYRRHPTPKPQYTEHSNDHKEDHYSHSVAPKAQHVEHSSERPNYPESFFKEEAHHHPTKSHHVTEFPKHEPYKPTQHKHEPTPQEHLDLQKPEPSRPPKYYEEPSPAPSYAKVTTYPTQETSSSQHIYHRVQAPAGDPYKFKPSPTPEISSSSHGFHKPTSPNFPKYIPTKMPDFEEPTMSFKRPYSTAEPISNYIPSSTQGTFIPEYPKTFSLAPTTYSPKYVSTPDVFDFTHMSEAPKSFSKYSEPTPSTKVYGTIVPSIQPFKTLSTKIVMKPAPTEYSFPDELKESSLKSLQNRTTTVDFKPSPTEDPKSEYYTNPEHTTYYVFANGTEINLGNDPSKIPPEYRVNSGDASYYSTNYSTKLAEDYAMKYNWDTIPSTTRDSEVYVSSETTLKDGKILKKKPLKPILYSKPIKPIKTVTIYRNTHRSADDTEMEGGFEPSAHYFKQDEIPQISDKRGEVTDDDEDFFFANGEVILQDDPSKATKKNAIFLPQGLNQQGLNQQVMLKLAQQQQQQQQQLQDQQVPDMDMSAEPSKKHQYFVLYHIEDNKKKQRPQPATTQAPTPPPVKQEIHYHYSEKETEDPEVTHEHYNYHHEETIEDSDDDIQHHYVNPNVGKFNYRPNIAHPSYKDGYKYKDAVGSGSETTLRVVDPDSKQGLPMEITKQEYMRHVQNAVIKYMQQLQEEGRLPGLRDRDSDDTQKTFEEVDISALINGNNAKHKFQLNPVATKVNLPPSPSHYKPTKTVPSSSSYKTLANLKIPKNTYPAGKPLKSAIESLQEQLGNSVDLTVKGSKPSKPDLSAIDVGQSYLHGPSYEPPTASIKNIASSYDSQSVVKIPNQKSKLHFSQQTYHDINSLTNLKDSQNLKPSSPYSSIKGGTANVGASISFGGNKRPSAPAASVHDIDSKLGPEALDAPIQIINGIPVTNPYNIDMNTLRYMLGGLAQTQVEQQQQQQQQNSKPQEPTFKLKGSNWMSLPTVASPAQIFSSNMPTFQHSPSESSNYKYNVNFDANNFKIKIPQKLKDFKMKPYGADTIGSASMNYASWGEPPRQNRQINSQGQNNHHQQHSQHQQQQVRPNREFNPELFLNPQFVNPVMKKKNGPPVDRKPMQSKPAAPMGKQQKMNNLDTNLRPPPAR